MLDKAPFGRRNPCRALSPVAHWTRRSTHALDVLGQSRKRANVEEKRMDKFTTLTGVAAPLPIDNVDTDMIIPKQYLKTIS